MITPALLNYALFLYGLSCELMNLIIPHDEDPSDGERNSTFVNSLPIKFSELIIISSWRFLELR